MIRFDYAGADLNDPLAFDALVSQMVDSSDPDHVPSPGSRLRSSSPVGAERLQI
ncbi:MAG: hypothetical protein WDO74_22280 [Pseudomonadota bacterium]